MESELYRLRNESAACQRMLGSMRQQHEAMLLYIGKAAQRLKELECENAALRSLAEPYAVLRDFRPMAMG